MIGPSHAQGPLTFLDLNQQSKGEDLDQLVTISCYPSFVIASRVCEEA